MKHASQFMFLYLIAKVIAIAITDTVTFVATTLRARVLLWPLLPQYNLHYFCQARLGRVPGYVHA